jgi:UDP-glucose 4-epimerase
MKCLLLGGGGFLGSHLCDALLARDYSVRIFERPNLQRYRKFTDDENVEWVDGDFTNEEDVASAVSGCDTIYHLVSTTLPQSSNDNPVYDVETNVVSTLRLLEVARQTKVRKIIFISSGGTVYGVPLKLPISEGHPTNPLCSYGIHKLAIEKYLFLYKKLHGLDYCVLRLANPYGERQRPTAVQGAVSVFLYKALLNEEVVIWGDGSVVRDYIYVGDAVDAMVKAIDYDGDMRTFNIGSGNGHSLNEILAEIERFLERPVKFRYTPGRSIDVPANVLNIERAWNLLHWRPNLTFREGLERTLEWLTKKYPAISP